VVVSYLVAALAALLSGLAYTEFVVDQPVAGGAFNMVSGVFGELAGWCRPPSTVHAGAAHLVLIMHVPRLFGSSAGCCSVPCLLRWSLAVRCCWFALPAHPHNTRSWQPCVPALRDAGDPPRSPDHIHACTSPI